MRFFTVIAVALLIAAVTGPALALELPDHPRLYLTRQGGEHIMSLEQLRSRAASERYHDVMHRAGQSSNPAERAMVYLMSGDTTGLELIRKALGGTVSRYTQLMDLALAFDWAYDAFDDTERKRFAAGLIKSARAVGERYRIPTAYHNMCRGRNMGQGLAMLAAWEDAPEAAEYEKLVRGEL